MATGTAGSIARHNSTTQVSFIRRNFTFADQVAATVVGVLPAGAIIVGAGVIVGTAFNAAGNDLLDIGTVADPDGLATILDLSTKGNIVWDELATSDDLGPFAADTTIVMTYTFTSTAPTAGVGVVYVMFIEDTDVH